MLNSIALGSLFTGDAGDISKGEILWKLAHTAVATSWHNMIGHKGPYDSRCGVQLVLTALLGQTYAILSKNARLRKTAQVFHSLGFFWARETGLYDAQLEQTNIVPQLEDDTELLELKWKVWAAREIQLRALLGHYVLDGQISHYIDAPTSQRHSTNSLPLPCADNLFDATTVQQWSSRYRLAPPRRQPFCSFFNALFTPNFHLNNIGPTSSSFTISLAIEGIKSLLSDNNICPIKIVGCPSKIELAVAASRIYALISINHGTGQLKHHQIMLRWQSVCLDAEVNIAGLCRNLCHQYSISQKIFGGIRADDAFDLSEWSRSSTARFGLLHAIEIRDMIEDLPLNGAQNLHVPIAIMGAAVVYCGWILSNTVTVALPKQVDWESTILLSREPDIVDGEPESDVVRFIHGLPLHSGQTRNLRYDMSSFSRSLKISAHSWGVALEMHHVLEQLLSACDAALT